jgi:hypothetical protein
MGRLGSARSNRGNACHGELRCGRGCAASCVITAPCLASKNCSIWSHTWKMYPPECLRSAALCPASGSLTFEDRVSRWQTQCRAASAIWPRPSTSPPEVHAAALRLHRAAVDAGVAGPLNTRVESSIVAGCRDQTHQSAGGSRSALEARIGRRHVMVAALDQMCALLQWLATAGSDHADEVLASLAQSRVRAWRHPRRTIQTAT